MTVHHKLTITRPGAAPHAHRGGAPVSTPPGYNFQFGGSAARMHEFGHIWFNQDPPGITISIEIASANFVFANAGTDDGSLALFISDDPANKLQFNGFGGVFSAPTLDTASFTKLSFSSNGGGKLYYYQLNVIDQLNNVVVGWDPIIINQP